MVVSHFIIKSSILCLRHLSLPFCSLKYIIAKINMTKQMLKKATFACCWWFSFPLQLNGELSHYTHFLQNMYLQDLQCSKAKHCYSHLLCGVLLFYILTRILT